MCIRHEVDSLHHILFIKRFFFDSIISEWRLWRRTWNGKGGEVKYGGINVYSPQSKFSFLHKNNFNMQFFPFFVFCFCFQWEPRKNRFFLNIIFFHTHSLLVLMKRIIKGGIIMMCTYECNSKTYLKHKKSMASK